MIVYHDRHNLPERDNSIQVENLHIQINEVNRSIDLKVPRNERVSHAHCLTVNIT